jgi:VanZ family protein
MLKRITILFSLFILLIIALANVDGLGFLNFINRIPFGDKAGHFILFGILSFLLNKSALSLFPKWDSTRLVLTVSLLLSILVGLEEWSQSLIPARTMSLTDLLASYAGVIVFALLAYWKRP